MDQVAPDVAADSHGRRYLIAADTGGTFTDLAVFDTQTGETRFGKTLTTYGDLVEGVIAGLEDTKVGLDQAAIFKHGTTHVINAFIQRQGARTALVTTKGFRDVLEIARGNRPETFDLRYRRQECLVPRRLRFEVEERIEGKGEVVQPLDHEDVKRLIPVLRDAGVEAIAVSLLNSYVNPVHEEEVARILSEALPGVYVTSGTRLSREWMEYERTSTAVANAFVGARMSEYITGFFSELNERDFRGRFYLSSSSGGVITAEDAVAQPIALVESGPVGGCIGAAAYATALKLPRVVAFDMGGTTAKCALVEDGRFDVISTYWVGGYERGFPIRTPVLDIVEVGAGGGSVAWVDENKRMRLGPKSAGSTPGPIAFGRGGSQPTVTDANVVLGRIGSDSFMGGRLTLDVKSAEKFISEQLALPLGYSGPDAIDQVSQGILDLANVTMAGAIKEITVERGRDIRDYLLFVFGGGGPLFAAELARDLGIKEVVVPPHPGAFSSLGMLMTEARRDAARTFLSGLSPASVEDAESLFETMERELRESMSAEFDVRRISYVREADMNYVGQSHTVRVSLPPQLSVETVRSAFEKEYLARYGHSNEGMDVAFVALRTGGVVPTARPSLEAVKWVGEIDAEPEPHSHRSVYFAQAKARLTTPVYRRSDLAIGAAIEGPAVVEEYSSTTVIGAGDRLVVGKLGELHITCAINRKAERPTHE
ncbi:hydantoinase/oxoprolinase family protein [Bradyrhizobium sp. KB893862 SZCCT0404]|uniref:hydantoinase/oxoprolinase family protein n=1 Tax=Bradyrhizobium sp. KB893862 SZCCT0404 TaxID=2807672 RepID=UPI001BA7B65B|nr:hydantoinase/oxoprolinase family protein [Bradyrhizobium sp. KB893862 SZCCT0404]MBR1172743.1 hydantoinase/oxoprolinase family protein [Bradyrhizobium sp. KB893862 SZCCT0404]